MLRSGRKDNFQAEGVALILGKRVPKSLIGWEPISHRILRASLNRHHDRGLAIPNVAWSQTTCYIKKHKTRNSWWWHKLLYCAPTALGSSVGTVRHLELYLSQRLIDKYVLNLMCILIDMMIIALKFYKYSCFIKLAFKILKRNGFVISLN